MRNVWLEQQNLFADEFVCDFPLMKPSRILVMKSADMFVMEYVCKLS